jgi:CheY-like chemotaxis protein
MMSDETRSIVRYIPYLRRYARALTGSQGLGDEYVRGCLELILAEPDHVVGDDPRLQLFKSFHEVWSAIHGAATSGREPTEPEGAPSPKPNLIELAGLERQVLLLVYLEGFSLPETATILNIDEATANDRLQAAREEIKTQDSIPVLIIEDEQLIAMDIARIVEEMGHTVCGTVARGQDAIDTANRERPGLILADIRLQDGDSGIVAVQNILESCDAPVIFVTGFPERLLTGNTLEPAFLITKPFDPDTLKVAIGQALSLRANA